MSAGGRFAALFVAFPVLVLSVYASFAIPAWLLQARLGYLVLLVGLAAAFVVCLWVVAGTPEGIPHSGGLKFCPEGFATWWPRWLSRWHVVRGKFRVATAAN